MNFLVALISPFSLCALMSKNEHDKWEESKKELNKEIRNRF